MKFLEVVVVLIAIAFPVLGNAQKFPIEAKTPDGKAVVLYEDGTWRPKTLQLDHTVIRKSEFATKMLTSRAGFYEFWIDEKTWISDTPSGDFEYMFSHKSNEAWCGIIAERIQMTKDALPAAIMKNLTTQDPEAKLIQKSKAYVNGLAGEVLEISATTQGYLITYYPFIWTGSKGTVQLYCWAPQNLMEEYRGSFNDFFGGFILTQ